MTQTRSTVPVASRRWWQSLGPAIIVASVVLGPGSILLSSRVGTEFGYGMLWMLVGAAALMMGMMALGSRLGVVFKRTPCEEVAVAWGRPAAIVLGITVFLIIALFQSSNNVAVLSAIDPLLPGGAQHMLSGWSASIILVALNAVVIAVLFGFKNLYKPIERGMMVLVMIMLVAFVANLIAAQPSLTEIIGGLVPSLPEDAAAHLVPYRDGATLRDPWWPIQGLLGTTFSIAGAFYQAYLVREKGWGLDQVKQGTTDSIVGIAVLGGISMMIMITAAAVFNARGVQASELRTIADVARQLEPAFGQWATVLFSIGLFAAAFSSFLINAVIGGTILSDSLKLGHSIDQPGPKLMTTLALVVGCGAAIFSSHLSLGRVDAIVLAQALTVLGLPLLAVAMFYLALRSRKHGQLRVPMWMTLVAVVSILVTLALVVRTGWRLYLQLT